MPADIPNLSLSPANTSDGVLEHPSELDSGEEALLNAACPYSLGDSVHCTLPELAAAILKHWDLALKDWRRGDLLRWLEHELHDPNLLHFVRNLSKASKISPETQLLRLVRACDAKIPLTWRGRAISLRTVLTAASSTQESNQDWLFSLYRERILGLLKTDKDRHRLIRLFKKVDQAWPPLAAFWKKVGEAADEWRQMPYLNDYSDQNSADLQKYIQIPWQFSLQPQKRHFLGDLLLALSSSQYAERIRHEILMGTLEVIGYCPWFAQVGNPGLLNVPQLVAAKHLLNEARNNAKNMRRADGEFRRLQSGLFSELQQSLRRNSMIVKRVAEPFPRTVESALALQRALEPLIETCGKIMSVDFIDSKQAAWTEKIAHLHTSLTEIQSHLLSFTEKRGGSSAQPSEKNSPNFDGLILRGSDNYVTFIFTALAMTVFSSITAFRFGWHIVAASLLLSVAAVASWIDWQAGLSVLALGATYIVYRNLTTNTHLKAAKKIYKMTSNQLTALSYSPE